MFLLWPMMLKVEVTQSVLLDDDNHDHDVKEDKEDPRRHVGDDGKAAAEEWVTLKNHRQYWR